MRVCQYTNTVTYACGLRLGAAGLTVEGVYAQGTLDLAPCADEAGGEAPGAEAPGRAESGSGAPGPEGAWAAQRARLAKKTTSASACIKPRLLF